MPTKRNSAEAVAEDYYDSDDADRFYELVWGGEDIHIGLYEPGLTISEASRRTVAAMADALAVSQPGIGSRTKMLDLGAGYGGSARYLAARFGCHVTCLNLSDVQNERNRRLNTEQGVDTQVRVEHGSFEKIPEPDSSFDIVWSQDAFLHSGRRKQVVAEIDRVLKAGGEAIFTDPMQADTCPNGVLQPVYDRLSLDSLASPQWYRAAFQEMGYEDRGYRDLTGQLRRHYANVRESLQSRYSELSRDISKAYLDRMIQGLGHWVDAADKAYLAWGILHFVKPGQDKPD